MASAKSPKSILSYLPASTGRLEDRIRCSAALLELVGIQCPAQGHFIMVETCQWEAGGNMLVQASSAWTAGFVEVFVHWCVDAVLLSFIYNLLFPSFLIKLIKFCVSPAAACRPRGVLQWVQTHREPGITLWPLSRKTGQSLRRDPRKKTDAAKIQQCGKMNVITEKKKPKSQTSVGKLKTSHNGN